MQLNSKTMKQVRLLLIVILGSTLIACAGNEEQQTLVESITEAYEQAKTSIARGNYRRGIQIFEAIQARYPFSDLSRQIQLELMYAYYKSGQKEQAVETADTFIRENPIHALYTKGLSYFEGDPGILERWFRKDTDKRPPKDIERAYASLRQLVERFPASEYAPDAEQRMLYIKSRLAEYENYVADYYLRRGAYVAALNRAKAALEQFNGVGANARSLEILASAYEKLGMFELAADTRKILEANFPNEG